MDLLQRQTQTNSQLLCRFRPIHIWLQISTSPIILILLIEELLNQLIGSLSIAYPFIPLQGLIHLRRWLSYVSQQYHLTLAKGLPRNKHHVGCKEGLYTTGTLERWGGEEPMEFLTQLFGGKFHVPYAFFWKPQGIKYTLLKTYEKDTQNEGLENVPPLKYGYLKYLSIYFKFRWGTLSIMCW